MTTTSCNGLSVLARESGRARKTAKLIENLGGVPIVAPSVREVSPDPNQAALEFARRLAAGLVGLIDRRALRLRKALEEQFSEEYVPWVQQLGEMRSHLFQDPRISSETRREILHEEAGATAFEAFRASPRR